MKACSPLPLIKGLAMFSVVSLIMIVTSLNTYLKVVRNLGNKICGV